MDKDVLIKEIIGAKRPDRRYKPRDFRVAIIEDDDIMRVLVESHFYEFETSSPFIEDERKFKIQSYSSGEDFLENHLERPDVVVLDFYLDSENVNNMNGKKVREEILSLYASMPVIILSGQRDASIVADLLEEGVSSYVLKNTELKSHLKISVVEELFS